MQGDGSGKTQLAVRHVAGDVVPDAWRSKRCFIHGTVQFNLLNGHLRDGSARGPRPPSGLGLEKTLSRSPDDILHGPSGIKN